MIAIPARRLGLLTMGGAAAVIFLVLIRTAWISDDAYITFRTVDQWLSGHGPRWNVGERVQVYSHPLWFVVLTAITAVVGEPYFAALVLGGVCTIAAALVLLRASAGGVPLATVLGVIVLLASNAFVDYSTSGLENPLTNLLLASFLALWWKPADDGVTGATNLLPLTLVTALLLTNRMDAAVLVLPALAVRLARAPWRQVLRTLAIGMLPFIAWEAFSLLYYGFPFPNPAYAKIATGIPVSELFAQGLAYFRDSVRHDPVTLNVVNAGIVTALAFRPRRNWPLALGVFVYLFLVARAGGDFMSGRFFVAPLVVGAGLLVRAAASWRPWFTALTAAVVIVLALMAPHVAALTGSDYSRATENGAGIQDERGYYYRVTGLLRPNGQWRAPFNASARKRPADIWPGHFVAVQDVIGTYGYQAPLSLHIIDVCGLAEPLLSRLPAQRPWRIGHFYRPLPEGYLETIESGANRLRDPKLAEYYDQLALVVRGPLLSRARLSAILALNLGRSTP